MKINGHDVPDHFTHESATDLFMSTAVGRSTEITRDEFLTILKRKHPTEEELNTFMRGQLMAVKMMLEGAPTGVQ